MLDRAAAEERRDRRWSRNGERRSQGRARDRGERQPKQGRRAEDRGGREPAGGLLVLAGGHERVQGGLELRAAVAAEGVNSHARSLARSLARLSLLKGEKNSDSSNVNFKYIRISFKYFFYKNFILFSS